MMESGLYQPWFHHNGIMAMSIIIIKMVPKNPEHLNMSGKKITQKERNYQ